MLYYSSNFLSKHDILFLVYTDIIPVLYETVNIGYNQYKIVFNQFIIDFYEVVTVVIEFLVIYMNITRGHVIRHDIMDHH